MVGEQTINQNNMSPYGGLTRLQRCSRCIVPTAIDAVIFSLGQETILGEGKPKFKIVVLCSQKN